MSSFVAGMPLKKTFVPQALLNPVFDEKKVFDADEWDQYLST